MYTIKISLTLILSVALWGNTIAQTHHTHEEQTEESDTVKVRSIRELFTKGEVEGHIRNYFIATINHKELTDNYANAIGAKIGFRTAPYHGVRLGFAGLFTYNAFSSDLSEADPIARRLPGTELELFDIEDPTNGADLDRLDELYLEYKSEGLFAQAGRISFTSPLINPQDTRMKPYAAQGIQVQVPIKENNRLTLAWLDHFSPRSTVEWFTAGESIGIYGSGVDPQGEPSEYEHHTKTAGVAIAGLQAKPHPRVQTEIWNYFIENISNNLYGKALVEVAPQVSVGVEGLYQNQLGNGGNKEEGKRYFPDQKQWLIGGRLAYEPKDWSFSLNYLHTGNEGRFLFPREWGREQFFATLPRGRMEGTGNADLLALRVVKRWSDQLSVEGAVAKAWMPSVDDHRFNKYGQPSYVGLITDIHYTPQKPVLDGLSFRLLYVGRFSDTSGLALEDMYYKTNFHQINLVTQITF
ncbi:hypothetical protein ABID22_002389 [Pontibacter aydingkolensis]|uniref:Porin n=1 Tax=Pontibacter aydingkolensis TaxID=1911536 RepID=A0ABS7CW23_9BACT|nr:porin [Pontibacter aydingkolensis]MBW7467990.1 porin [Pontibacter aydingkolensis]